MFAITISRETGSQGHYIAEKVARTLGFHLADKHTIARICTKYGLNEFAELGLTSGYVPDFWTHFDLQGGEHRRRMVSLLNQVILALAHYGNMLILGRSSFAVLGEYTDVLNVRIQAPMHLRVESIKQRGNIASIEQAKALVTENDRIRRDFIQWFYGSTWNTSEAFDLVINTGKVPPDTTVSWLVEAVEVLKKQDQSGTRNTASIQVDPLLTAIVAEEFQVHHVEHNHR
jgi:cytidylate kinase